MLGSETKEIRAASGAELGGFDFQQPSLFCARTYCNEPTQSWNKVSRPRIVAQWISWAQRSTTALTASSRAANWPSTSLTSAITGDLEDDFLRWRAPRL